MCIAGIRIHPSCLCRGTPLRRSPFSLRFGRRLDAAPLHFVQMIHEKTDSRREDAFVIRIWHEPGTEHEAPWRAIVKHLESGERRFFTNYGELCEFLDRFARRMS